MLRMRNVFLVSGMVLGICLAMNQLAEQHASLPQDAVARVNQQLISRQYYAKAVAAMAADLRRQPTAEDRQHVLDQLINEELLFQNALQQGMAYNDSRVRRTLVSAMLDNQRLLAESQEISEQQAQQFYQQQPDLFLPSWRYRVGLLSFSGARAQEQAEQTRRRLNQGAAFEAFASEQTAAIVALPNSLLPLSKLRDYLGSAMADSISHLQPGQASALQQRGTQWQVLYLHQRQRAAAPPWTQLKPLVISEMRRRQAEKVLHNSLQALRQQAHIRIGHVD